MCGIAGIVDLKNGRNENLAHHLSVMGELIKHRGPDDDGIWVNPRNTMGLAHRRLSILDLTDAGKQPMVSHANDVIAFNGEIYNFKELRDTLKHNWDFKSNTDTEVLLALYAKFGVELLEQLRGMYAFSIWDESKNRLFCARDRFGIKPFYYCVVDGKFYFASEVKSLLPFVKSIQTNASAFSEYLTFQYNIGEQTMFDGIKQLLPGNAILVENGEVKVWRYWDVDYDIDFDHSKKYFEETLRELMADSISLHMNSDVPIGAYVSGGIDSSLVGILSSQSPTWAGELFNGRFTEYPGYDESEYAKGVGQQLSSNLHIADIGSSDFVDSIDSIIYHLDYPVAGPGSFPQYMVSKLASQHVKVVLGGQGGDELFGGYARYLIAYFEQCFLAALDGSYKNGNYVVTIESIVPNLSLLKNYKPLIKEFWREGLFESLDDRYFRLCNRSNDMKKEVDWTDLDIGKVKMDFKALFNNPQNVRKEAYFDKMTHFDFKCLLPALLHVEDRMSMAHGLEARVPFLDHKIVEFAATIPANIKFEDGNMKNLLKNAFRKEIPKKIMNRTDKMGFPVPLKEWFSTDLKDKVVSVFEHARDKDRPHIVTDEVLKNVGNEGQFSRKIWGLLSLELWHQQFHDQSQAWKDKLKTH